MHKESVPLPPEVGFIVVVIVFGPVVIGIIKGLWWLANELRIKEEVLRLRRERIALLFERRTERNQARVAQILEVYALADKPPGVACRGADLRGVTMAGVRQPEPKITERFQVN